MRPTVQTCPLDRLMAELEGRMRKRRVEAQQLLAMLDRVTDLAERGGIEDGSDTVRAARALIARIKDDTGGTRP